MRFDQKSHPASFADTRTLQIGYLPTLVSGLLSSQTSARLRLPLVFDPARLRFPLAFTLVSDLRLLCQRHGLGSICLRQVFITGLPRDAVFRMEGTGGAVQGQSGGFIIAASLGMWGRKTRLWFVDGSRSYGVMVVAEASCSPLFRILSQ
jgi:hypothetical protein